MAMIKFILGHYIQQRDLNYVSDICNGFIALAKCDTAVGREINIGSQTEISIEESCKSFNRTHRFKSKNSF